MPIYCYKCPDCCHTEEKIEPLEAPTSHDCPECEGTAKRLPSAPSQIKVM